MTASGIEPGTVARDILEAVREAVDVPNGAIVGDQETRDRILLERLGHAAVMLRRILDEPATTDIRGLSGTLRARLAEHPAAGYRTWEQATGVGPGAGSSRRDAGDSAVPITNVLLELTALTVDADHAVRYALVHRCLLFPDRHAPVQPPGWRGVRLSVTNVPIGDVTTRPSSRKAVADALPARW